MLNDLLNSLQRDGTITEAVSLRSFAGTLSVSVAFVTSRVSSTDWTSQPVELSPTYQGRLVHWQHFQMKRPRGGGRECNGRELVRSRS